MGSNNIKANTLPVVNIGEIYKAKTDVLIFSAKYEIALKELDYEKAYRIRHKINDLKRDIKRKYAIIL